MGILRTRDVSTSVSQPRGILIVPPSPRGVWSKLLTPPDQAARLIVQDDVQEGRVHFESAVVLDEPELAEFVHEIADA
jgi:hypothetical protein